MVDAHFISPYELYLFFIYSFIMLYKLHAVNLIPSSGQRTEALSAPARQTTKLPGAFAPTRVGPQESQEER